MIYANKFMADSEAAEAAVPNKRLGVPGGPTVMENLDIFMPQTKAGKAPIVVFIHGGYWKSLTSRVFSMVATGPVAAGMCVVNVTYALCPEVEIGEIVRQVGGPPGVDGAECRQLRRRSRSDHRQRPFRRRSLHGHHPADQLGPLRSANGCGEGRLCDQRSIRSGAAGLRVMQPALRITGDTILRHSPQRNVVPVATPLAIAWGTAEPDAFSGQSKDFAAAWSAAGNRSASLRSKEQITSRSWKDLKPRTAS